MRLFTMFLTAMLLTSAATFVYAADEFGARFGGDIPTALKESTPGGGVNPQDIEPAAGGNSEEENLKTESGAEANPATRSSKDSAPPDAETLELKK